MVGLAVENVLIGIATGGLLVTVASTGITMVTLFGSEHVKDIVGIPFLAATGDNPFGEISSESHTLVDWEFTTISGK